ncbi:PREDICTED: uncharacterized protein LOC109350520 [Lupinus angustifolius]|uniref:uncharacterized protein LOC109350520 n=1 Tax=Lupinus angustifolius TaxID=3871 RepID=UPI00092F5479|nr:PREDICTED: uncharacterized protein LOC109350520 [Lupinus angustifolius]
MIGWRMYVDYRKLNQVTRHDQFPLPFMDQIIERLVGKIFYCFLDGYSRYNTVDLDDQEKTTFTCPFGIFSYRKMLYGLCNALAIFQRCMLAMFSDLVEHRIEVFMDEFAVFGSSFDEFDLVIKDKKRKREFFGDHLSRLVNQEMIEKEAKVEEEFPDEKLLMIQGRPWFPDMTNLKVVREIEVFDCWGTNFMGPFQLSHSLLYILVEVDYVSKWVEAITPSRDDAKTVVKFLEF